MRTPVGAPVAAFGPSAHSDKQAEDLGCINLMVDVVEVLRILAQVRSPLQPSGQPPEALRSAQVFSPPVMETLHWEPVPQTHARRGEDSFRLLTC